jgi:beta-glucosidase
MKKSQIQRFITNALVLVIITACNHPSTPSTRRVEKIIKKMTLQEKIEFIGGYNSFNIRPYEAYGIPEIRMSDGPVGVRNYGASTAYPASICLAASWDKNMAAKVGAAIGMEARKKDINIILGPAMNIHRAPFCGRNFEYLGEDPFLAGEIASEFILGMQEQGVIATAKHYVANYQDYDRHTVSSDMDERTLQEIYLPAFKACVQKGRVGAVMTSYNLVNGIHASQNDFLINQILKNDWGFEGIVMSDWTSTYNGLACAKAGLDLEMPAGVYMNPDTLIPAIENGEIDEEIINEKVRRILNLYERFGLFENPDISQNYTLDRDYVRSMALDEARGGITLLKNEDHILPIDTSQKLKIAVIGINAYPAVTGGGGSSYTEPLYPVSLLEAITKVSGNQIEVIHAQALAAETRLPSEFFNNSDFYTYVNGKKQPGLSANFFGNLNLEGSPVYSTVFKILNHTLSDSVYPNLPKISYSACFDGFLKVSRTGNYRIAVSGDDGYRVYLNDKVIIDHWHNQPETVRSCRTILQAGKENKIRVEYYQDGGDASIRLGYIPELGMESFEEKLWNEAVKAVTTSDFVIFSVGFNRNNETEGMDRTWELPNGQDEMVSKLSTLNQNCIVVLNAGGNVSMPWLKSVKGLIHAWYPGQEGNIAVAEILFGITNPSGKLPVSFEDRLEDNATYTSYFDTDGDKRVFFSEGVFLGYRHFDKSSIKPRFPFGYGLSYTTFAYSNIKTDKQTYLPGEKVKVSFTIENTGNYDGAEVTQLYVSDLVSELPRPVKELKGFEKIFLNRGEMKTITLELDKSAFSYFDKGKGGWVTEPGKFELLIGSSSEDIRLSTEIELLD